MKLKMNERTSMYIGFLFFIICLVENHVDTAGIRAYLQSRLTYSKQANDTWRYDLLGQALDTPGFNNSTDRENKG